MNWLAIAVAPAVAPAALALALAIDRAWGEPPAWAHPVVAMGRWLGWAGRPWPACTPALALVGGGLAWALGALVCVDTRWLDASFCGAAYDAALLARLPAGVCPVGEDGEFHTVVLDGPGFAAPLAVQDLPQRRVATQPPWAPTVLVFQPLAWPAAASGAP